MWELANEWMGLDQQAFELRTEQTVLRAIVVFVLAVAMARIASKRFMAPHSAFDLILGIMLGSVLSRAITGQSPFLPTIAAGAALVFMHSIFAWVGFRWDRFGYLVKGHAKRLVEDGEVVPGALKRHQVGENDLQEALRIHGGGASIEDVDSAYLERNGEISILLKDR